MLPTIIISPVISKRALNPKEQLLAFALVILIVHDKK